MNNWLYTFNLIFVSFVFFSLFSCSKDEPIEETITVSDEFFSWTVNDIDFESIEEEVFGINVNGLFILAEDASEWGMYMDLGIGPLVAGRRFELNESTDIELYLYDNRGSRWSSNNTGGSAEVLLTSYLEVEDDFFIDGILEGTFSGTLTVEGDTTVCNISNGIFKVEI